MNRRVPGMAAARAAAWILILGVALTAQGAGGPSPGGTAHGLARLFRDSFPAYTFREAYVDAVGGYLVVSLGIRPEAVAGGLAEGEPDIDTLLKRSLARGLYAEPVSFYLLSAPALRGIRLQLAWQDCRRERGPNGRETVLPAAGLSERGTFGVSRKRYFQVLAAPGAALPNTPQPRPFDEVCFSHFGSSSYRGLPGHRTENPLTNR